MEVHTCGTCTGDDGLGGGLGAVQRIKWKCREGLDLEGAFKPRYQSMRSSWKGGDLGGRRNSE